MKQFFKRLAFSLGYNQYKVETDRFWQIFQFHPQLGVRVRPSMKDLFDSTVMGKYDVDMDKWTVSFMDEADAALFKLTFS